MRLLVSLRERAINVFQWVQEFDGDNEGAGEVNMSTLTTVIPTHNRVEVLTQALRCLDSGSVLPDEVIVVDDASDVPVQSGIASESFRFPIRIIRFDKNRGASCARNTGIRAATKDLVLLMDDDIWSDHDMIRYHKYFHEKHSSRGYAVSGRVFFDPCLVRTPMLHFLEEHGALKWLAKQEEGELYSTGILTANISMKREFLEDTELFDEDFPHNRNEDTEFGLRQMERGFEPRFHKAPSARHHSPLTLEDNYRILTKSGDSKAYWMCKKPDDTRLCLFLDAYVIKEMRRDEFLRIYNEFIERLGPEFFEADVWACSPANIEEFNRFYLTAQVWIQSHGITSSFFKTIPGFERIYEDIEDGLRCKDTEKGLGYFRKTITRNPEFMPAAVFLSRKLTEAHKYEEAREIIAPFKDSIWSKLILGELACRMGRYKECVSLLMEVYERTGYGKAVEQEQRKRAADLFLKCLPKDLSSNDMLLELWESMTEVDKMNNPGLVEAFESLKTTRRSGDPAEDRDRGFHKLKDIKALRIQMENIGKPPLPTDNNVLEYCRKVARRLIK